MVLATASDFPCLSRCSDIPPSPAEDGSGGETTLVKGETVLVTGASSRRGHLMVQHRDHTVHVPHQYLELKMTSVPPTAAPVGKL